MDGQDYDRTLISQLKLKRMLTKQLRELERQATVVNQPNEHLIKYNKKPYQSQAFMLGLLVDFETKI